MIKKEIEQQKESLQNGKSCSCLCHYHDPSHCHCACRYLKFDSGHQPFLIRQCILASGVFVGILGAVWGWYDVSWREGVVSQMGYSLSLGLACYFCMVTLGDGISHFVLKLKPSAFVDEEKLLQEQNVTPQELDHYCDTRRYIRMSSFAMASLVFGVSWCDASAHTLTAFCTSYVLSTILGILVVQRTSNRKRPRIIRLDNQYYRPIPPLTGHNYILWQQGKLPYWW